MLQHVASVHEGKSHSNVNPVTIAVLHERKKSFKCESCDYSFNLNCDLQQHVALFHEENPFKCEFYDYNSDLKDNLQQHIASVHKGEKLFTCESCDYCCDLKGDLQQHIVSVHKVDNNSCFAFKFVNAGDVSRIISGLKNTKALGVDNIGTDVLKKGILNLAGPIARLCDSSLASGIVPDIFKKAIIHPVFKGQGKDPRDPRPYRPVAILPALSKILEIVVRESLLSWFKHVDFLPESQIEFLPGKSVAMALTLAQNDWIHAKLKIEKICLPRLIP